MSRNGGSDDRSDLTHALPQRWRLRSPSGRELVFAAKPGVRYVDKYTGEELKVAGQLLPLAPSPSRLPWSPENLRVFPYCDQLVQKDLNHCPYDGRPLPPLDRYAAASEATEGES